MKILAVDDNKDNVELLCQILEDDYDMIRAYNGADCIKRAKEQKPDLIILDVQMPEMNGYEVIERLKEDESTKDIYVIFLTARYRDTDRVIKGFELGAFDYITKPIEDEILLARVRSVERIYKAERMLIESEDRYRSYIEVTGQLGWTTNADGEVEEDIPTWREFTGQGEEEVKGWGWLNALHPDDREQTAQVWRKAVARKSNYETEYGVRRYDGIYRYFLARGLPVFNKDGSIREWVGTCIDITKRKKAEVEISKLAKFPSENPNPVLRVTEDGTVIYANNSSLPLLNFCGCQVGQPLPNSLRQYILDILDSGLSKDIEFTCEDRIFSLTFASISEANYVNIYGLNITERKQAEEELKASQAQLIHAEKMNALGTLVAGVAHELSNPMMSIINFIEYCLKKTSADDKRFTVLQSAEREMERCIAIVDNLLTFSHMEKLGEEEFQRESFTTILDRVFELLFYRFEKERVQLTKQYAQNIPEIWMRENGIQQVFLNIITNALDAIKESKKKELYIDIHREGEYVHVTIADSGPGIARKNLARIFDPFFTTKPPGQGTGLGLSTSQSIIEMHEGRITCESKAGQGAKFEIVLPIKRKRVTN